LPQTHFDLSQIAKKAEPVFEKKIRNIHDLPPFSSVVGYNDLTMDLP
jgi:hypothetical protein